MDAEMSAAFAAGFVVDALEEPVFPEAEAGRELGQARFPEIPWALIVRVRAPAG